jgi:hypothetical protein
VDCAEKEAEEPRDRPSDEGAEDEQREGGSGKGGKGGGPARKRMHPHELAVPTEAREETQGTQKNAVDLRSKSEFETDEASLTQVARRAHAVPLYLSAAVA